MSKGGQTATQQTTQQLNPFVQDLMTRGFSAAQNVASIPYQAYMGPRIAQFRPQEQQAFQMAERAATSGIGQPQLAQGLQALSQAQSQYGNVGSQFGQLASQAAQPVNAPDFRNVEALTGTQPMYSPAQFQQNVQGFMSPYQESVVDATMRRLAQTRAERDAETRSRLASSRAFGNERRGVYEAQLAAEQDLNTQQTLANLYQQGYGQAAGLAAQLPSQQLAQQAQAFGQQMNVAQNVAAQRAQMQQEVAQRLGLQGGFLGQQLSAANYGAALAPQFAGLGSQAIAQEQARQQMLMGAGQAQRQMAQQNLDLAYQDFLAQRGYPTEQLKILQSGIAGIPATTSSSTTSTTPGQGFLGTAGDVVGILGGLKKLGIF